MMGNMGLMIFLMKDPLLLNRLSTAIGVGAFHLGSLPARQIMPFMAVAMGSLQPALVTLFSRSRHVSLLAAFYKIGAYSLWAQGVLLCPLIVCRKSVFTLYLGARSETYRDAPEVLLLTLLAWLPYYSLGGLPRIAGAYAKVREFNLLLFVSALLNVLFTWHLLVRYDLGPVGAALALLLSVWAMSFLGFLSIGKLMFGVSLQRFLVETLVRGMAPWCVSLGLLLFLRQYTTTWPRLALVGVLSGSVFCMVVWVVMSGAERNDVRSGIRYLVAAVRVR